MKIKNLLRKSRIKSAVRKDRKKGFVVNNDGSRISYHGEGMDLYGEQPFYGCIDISGGSVPTFSPVTFSGRFTPWQKARFKELQKSFGKRRKKWERNNAYARALGTALGAGVASAALHTGLDAPVFDGRSAYDYAPVARFLPYLTFAFGCGKAAADLHEKTKGRKLTFGEKIVDYAIGALIASGLYETWEVIGSSVLSNPVHEVYPFAKDEFPGRGSLNDTLATAGLTVAGVAAKEYVSKLMRG